MSPRKSMRLVAVAILAMSAITWMACNRAGSAGQSGTAVAEGGKIPIDTKS
jgi:hypothetical protein